MNQERSTTDTRVTVENRSDGIAVITFDGPSRRNALAKSTMEDLLTAVRAAADDDGTRAVVVTGASGFFSAGADLKSGRPGRAGVGGVADRLATIQVALDIVHRMPKPVVAAVEGGAVGVAWSLVLASDLVVAGADAYFLGPFIQRGLVPDGGAAWFLVRAVGAQRAAELLMLPDRLPAVRAEALGLVNRVVPTGEALAEALAMAGRLAASAPDALSLTKRLLAMAERTPSYRDFLDQEWATAALALHGPDAREGRAAFVEGREPDFIRPQ
jgi:2-(1,2-epoxy-1,2-dihydrophenyl)acetyl-CoA isomerase